MRREFLPFNRPFIGEEEKREVLDSLESGWITTGPKVKRFEAEFAAYVGCEHATAVSSCTAAMHLSLFALDIGAGDEVILSPFTFASSANVILHQGAEPVFADIRRDTFNLDPERIEEKITPRTKAILVIHYGGQPAEMDPILEIAGKRGLFVIEDAAHAVGAEYKGRKIGTIGDFTCFSFYAIKNLTTAEGGMVTTADREWVEKIETASLHGMNRDAWKRYKKEGSWYYEVVCPGFKYNMTDIQAAIGLHQLRRLDEFNRRRWEHALAYSEAFREIDCVTVPFVKENVKHAWHLYPILLDTDALAIDRNEFIEKLTEENIGTTVNFIPVHLHPYYRETFGYKRGDFPDAEWVFDRTVSLPLYPSMTEDIF